MFNDWLLHYLWVPGWPPFLITWWPHLFTQASSHREFFTFNCWKNGPKWSLPQSFPGLKFNVLPRHLKNLFEWKEHSLSGSSNANNPWPSHGSRTSRDTRGARHVSTGVGAETNTWQLKATCSCVLSGSLEFLVYLNCSSVHLKICWFAWNPDFWNCLKLINLATLEQDDYLWGLGSNCPFWVPHSPPSQPGPLPSPFRNWIGTPQILLLLLFYQKRNWGLEKAKWFPQYHTTSKWQAGIAFKVCFALNWCF